MKKRRLKAKLMLPLAVAVAVLGLVLFVYGGAGTGRPVPGVPSCGPTVAASSSRTFHVDPLRGTDDGDGSIKRPWRSLQHVVDARQIGSQTLETRRLQYWKARLLRNHPAPRLYDNPAAVVRDGDTVLLATGDHGKLDLRGIYNRLPITIAGAPGADPVFSSVNIEGVANFRFQNFAVETAEWSANDRFRITMRPDPTARRSNNVAFDRLRVGGRNSIADFTPAEWAQTSSDGVLLFGDCLSITRSAVHDVHNAIVLYQVRKANVENVEIRDFSVDGIDFSGNSIAIRNNVIRDHWPTGDDLHPDCMHGQSTPDRPRYGPVLIEGNVCLSDLSARRSQIFQGINIFDGRWDDVTIRCNFVRPTLWHGISLYGVDSARIEHNIVMGWPGDITPWIASMPSKQGRDPTANLITGNKSTGYLNAIHGGPLAPSQMTQILKINAKDKKLQEGLAKPVSGVTLSDNEWLSPSSALFVDKRFGQVERLSPAQPISIAQAKAEIAAIRDCRP